LICLESCFNFHVEVAVEVEVEVEVAVEVVRVLIDESRCSF
jgi:hypothetical protein